MRERRRSIVPVAALAVAALAASLTACGDDEDRAPPATAAPTTPATSPAETPSPEPEASGAGLEPVVVGTVATGLDSPWGLAFLPDGSALVANRDDGHIVRVTEDGGVDEVGTVPGVVHRSESGLLGIAVPPDFEADPWVYAYFTTDSDNRIVRMRYDDGELGEPEILVSGIPAAPIHDGGRLAFGPDGMLYATAGDASESSRHPQDTESLGGKILRMTPEGEPAPDNPFGNLVWSYGHRNPQGIAWDDRDRLWAAEFGQNTWDELNLIERGGNYGWPEVEGKAGDPDFIDPLAQWSTDDASPSGIAIAQGAVYMAALRGQRLWQIPIEGDGVGEPRDFFVGEYGRLRTVAVAPDGALWLVTNNTDGRGDPADDDDKILRIELRPRS